MSATTNAVADSRPEHSEPKPLGLFGAPSCRCTETVIALTATLVGLILIGIGACMAAFWSHEPMPMYAGVALAVAGTILLVGGGFYFVVEHLRQTQNRRAGRSATDNIAYVPTQQMQMQTFNAAPPNQAPSPVGEAPPAYDSVVDRPRSRGATAYPRRPQSPNRAPPAGPPQPQPVQRMPPPQRMPLQQQRPVAPQVRPSAPVVRPVHPQAQVRPQVVQQPRPVQPQARVPNDNHQQTAV